MASNVDLKLVVKHIVNGTLADNLCRICLSPLRDDSENIFTMICKENKEYCIADVLEKVCQIKVSETDHFNVCADCFITASAAYRFYLLTKHNDEILNYYIDEIDKNITDIEPSIPENVTPENSLCISLPEVIPQTMVYDFDINTLAMQNHNDSDVSSERNERIKRKRKYKTNETPKIKQEKVDNDIDEDIIIIMDENGQSTLFKVGADGNFEPISGDEVKSNKVSKSLTSPTVKKKQRRKRDPMIYRECSQCPVKYRFIAKLKEHMKQEHNIDLYVCKICKAITEDETDFQNHLKTHTNVHACAICNVTFKKRDTIIAHLKWHEETKTVGQLEGAHVCEMCGFILPDEESLREHCDKKHDKKYTCYYCGRMYKGEISLNLHVKKHEMVQKKQDEKKESVKRSKSERRREHTCSTCGRSFVDERALLWHSRLHTNERPYVCETCGRGFISLNRRNQHAICAHTAPSRRCPLCPALFHLRSMVNTHIKKVHLKAHKRRNRSHKHQNVFWRTEPVPIQELSVSIQNDIIELQQNNASY